MQYRHTMHRTAIKSAWGVDVNISDDGALSFRVKGGQYEKDLSHYYACMLFILGSISTVYADENSTAAGSCSFTGKEMVSSFDSNKLAVSVSEMQPGDEVTFSVNIKNDSDISTKWYMSNDVLSSLEDAQSVAANGGYSYILTFVGPDGKEDTIYSSTSVGGEKPTTAGEGLKEATNSLDNFFYLKTLEPGESGNVKLLVGLDGESQGNVYQDTLAKLMMNFAVEDNSDTKLRHTHPTFTTTDIQSKDRRRLVYRF